MQQHRIRRGIRRHTVAATIVGLGGGMGILASAPCLAQTASATSGIGEQRILADSAPYRIVWNGTTGTLIRRALGQEPEERSPLTFLHAGPGPSGYAKHLVWFLARQSDGYSILWCYLNDDGQEFYCWLYRYPANQLTTLRFTGEYRFVPPPEPTTPTLAPNFQLKLVPRYAGPNFVYRDWTRQGGAISSLDLRAIPSAAPAGVSTGFAPPANTPANPSAVTRSLTGLQVFPLHEIHVASANGWRSDGWRELHSLAFDTVRDPYYLIQYSNSTRGYVIDLKRALVTTAEFGERIRFAQEPSIFGESEQTLDPAPEIRVRRFARHEIVLTANQDAANPFTDVTLEAEFRSPSGKRYLIPGFWDGGRTFRVRMAPTQVGTWTWRTTANTPELSGQSGRFECVSDDAASVAGLARTGATPSQAGTSNSQSDSNLDTTPGNNVGSRRNTPIGYRTAGIGFLRTASPALDSHSFARSNGVPFLPVYLRDPVQSLTGNEPGAERQGTGETAPSSPAPTRSALPATFVAFQKRMDAAAMMGFNRLIGGYLLEKPAPGKSIAGNEGGLPFLDGDISRPNPAYFQWMDRRIAYCNAQGIVPDVGLGWPDQGLFTRYNSEMLRRVWRYVVARYSAYDVCWNLFGRDDTPVPDETDARMETYAALTRLYDPIQHPLTTSHLGLLTIPTAAPAMPEVAAGANDAATPTARNESGIEDAPAPGRARRREPAAPFVPFPPDAFGLEDTITQVGGDLRTLDYLYRFDKPILLEERAAVSVAAPSAPTGNKTTTVSLAAPASQSAPPPRVEGLDPDIARQRLWETRMRGAFWAGGQPASRLDEPDGSTTPELDYAAACARFFSRTRFWRLEPHPEVLGGPEETPADRRRRKRAEAEARRAAGLPAGEKQPGAPAPPGQSSNLDGVPVLPNAPTATPATNPVYILSDPAWEYVIYFEQGGQATLDLLEATGSLKLAWFNPRLGQFQDETTITGGAYHTFVCPDKNDWVLYISRR